MNYKIIAITLSIFLFVSCVNEPESFIKFDGPTMTVVKPNGLIYVADGYYNSRIVVFDSEGNYIKSFGSKGYDKGEFQNPHGILLDSADNLWIADRDNGRIQIFDNKDNYIKEIYGKNLGRPWSLAITEDEIIYSLDGGNQGENTHAGISILNKSGEMILYDDLFGDSIGKINWGHSISVNEDGTSCYIVDIKQNYVCKLDKIISNENKSFTFIPDFNWISEVKKYVSKPISVAFSGNELFVGEDTPNASIKVFNALTGAFNREILHGVFKNPHSIFVDKNNYLWITDVDDNKVHKVNKDGKVLLTIEGDK